MAETIRVAAAGDMHVAEPLRQRIAHAFAALPGQADVVLLAGDLTTHGDPAEAAVLADACRPLDIPVYAVLGNHDYHLNRCEEVVAVLEDAGIHVLQRDYAVLEVAGLELGVVGTKGFVGGFPGAELPDFGEPLLREVYAETTREVDAIETGLQAVAGCHRRVVLLHYAPVPETLVGEPEPIWAFLGSSRLATPIGGHRPDLVLHGHAHRGTFAAQLGPVPVRNVAVHVIGKDFELFHL
jgi:Icc-related predicted phosphoesterase